MFKLQLAETGAAREVLLPEGDTVLGRAPTCDVLIADPSVSRWHARFTVAGDRCTVSDVGSRNGTFVNGEPVQTTAVRNGDEVVLGELRVMVEESSAPSIVWSEGGLPDAAATYRAVDAPAAPGRDTAETLARLRKLLADIAGILLKASTDTDVLERIVQLAFDHFGADRAVLLLPGETTGEMMPRVMRSRDPAHPPVVSRSVVARVMRDRVAILATDLNDSVFQSESILLQNVRSFMCAPLWHEQSVSGALYVDNPLQCQFTSQDIEVLVSFANYAAIAIEQVRLAATLREETRRRERLQRYHSPGVVAKILQAGDARVEPQERDVSILFADLVSFTSLAERLPPSTVAQLLNEALSIMTEAVFTEDGTLDKYIGDAILAVFGAPLDQADHAARAVRAATDMRRRLDARNEQAEPRLQLRIGISSGLVVAGDVGSMKRREYTVLGDVVNTAARLQAAVAEPGEIVITAATANQLEDSCRLRPKGLVPVRGRQQPVDVFVVEE
jgi:adenylate cyclase